MDGKIPVQFLRNELLINGLSEKDPRLKPFVQRMKSVEGLRFLLTLNRWGKGILH
jgi:hypothetical protein